MRLNHTLFVIIMMILFAGSASSASFDTHVYQEISSYNFDLQENAEGDDDPAADIAIYFCGECPRTLLLKNDISLSHSAQQGRPRLVSFPLLPQAPPARI